MQKIILLLSILCFTILVNAQCVSTLAGSEVYGYVDAVGTSAKFLRPRGIAVDASGNVYVADSDNNVIRKISPTGVVTTLAGSKVKGYIDGIGTSAKFYHPESVAVDGSGNVYVADTWNNIIRKISPIGEVTTLAGSTSGYADGTGTSAQFSSPAGIAVDASGNVYVADTDNNKIRKISPTGEVTTLAGSTLGDLDGTGTSAKFSYPEGVAVDATGIVYIADTYNHKIRKISPTGEVTTLAGSTSGYEDGVIGTFTKFNYPKSVAVDRSGNVYVADIENSLLRKISPTGVVTTFAGSSKGYLDGIGTSAQFKNPEGVAVDASGNIYVADTWNDNIRKIINNTIDYSGNPFCSSILTAQPVTISATGGTFSSTTGLSINSITGAITPSKSKTGTYTVTYTIPSSKGCATQQVTKQVTISEFRSASFNYAGNPFCKTLTTPQAVTLSGTGTYNGGTFSSTTGLTINSITGAITPSTSNPGTYTATCTIPSNGGCSSVTETTQITIGNLLNASLNYPGNPFCKSLTAQQPVILSGTGAFTGGTFSSTTGLTINSITGAITPSTSNPGTYTVSYNVPSSNGCTPVTTQVTITALPTASLNYAGNPFCKTLTTPQDVTLSGTGAYTGGTFSSTTGLTINATSGAINPSASNPGAYTVTYSIPSSGGCSSSIVSTQVNITALPTASINYSGSPFCKSLTSVQAITLGTGAFTGGAYSSSTGLSVDPTTGAINPSLSTAGTYTVTYSIPSKNGCSAVTVSTQLFIFALPTTSISADGVVATNTTINNGNSVQLQLYGSLNAVPNIQWTPATAINSTTVSNPIVYPNTTTTYTASFTNSNGCQQSTSFVVNVNPQPTIGSISLTSPSSAAIGLFDTITVDVQLTGATNLYSLFMKLKGNAEVNQYLEYQGFTASTLLGSGSSVISTPPTAIYGATDFGITKVGASSGYSGSGLYYTLRFVTKNISIPDGTVFCFYIDEVSSYNSLGTQCGLNNQGQICYTFTNQVNVWPGDLNNSKSVSTADILPIGYFYNSTGPTRPNATIQWNAQPATLWGYNHSSQNGNANKVFADSNGDGVINNADQSAIGFNMRQVRTQTNIKPFSIAPNPQKMALAVGELVVIPSTTIINGATLPQTVTFTVNINNTAGLYALYGISVNLIFDNTIFDLSTATIDYTSSIFGNAGTDFLVMNYNSASGVSVGLTRYANTAINGQGLLFKVTLQTKSTLVSALSQTQVTAYVDAANNQAGDNLVIQDAPVTNLSIIKNLGIDDVTKDDFLLYPNPTNDIMYLSIGKSIDQFENLKLIVFNSFGQIVNEIPIRNSNMLISTRNWGASGIYLVKIVDDFNNIKTTKKVILK